MFIVPNNKRSAGGRSRLGTDITNVSTADFTNAGSPPASPDEDSSCSASATGRCCSEEDGEDDFPRKLFVASLEGARTLVVESGGTTDAVNLEDHPVESGGATVAGFFTDVLTHQASDGEEDSATKTEKIRDDFGGPATEASLSWLSRDRMSLGDRRIPVEVAGFFTNVEDHPVESGGTTDAVTQASDEDSATKAEKIWDEFGVGPATEAALSGLSREFGPAVSRIWDRKMREEFGGPSSTHLPVSLGHDGPLHAPHAGRGLHQTPAHDSPPPGEREDHHHEGPPCNARTTIKMILEYADEFYSRARDEDGVEFCVRNLCAEDEDLDDSCPENDDLSCQEPVLDHKSCQKQFLKRVEENTGQIVEQVVALVKEEVEAVFQKLLHDAKREASRGIMMSPVPLPPYPFPVSSSGGGGQHEDVVEGRERPSSPSEIPLSGVGAEETDLTHRHVPSHDTLASLIKEDTRRAALTQSSVAALAREAETTGGPLKIGDPHDTEDEGRRRPAHTRAGRAGAGGRARRRSRARARARAEPSQSPERERLPSSKSHTEEEDVGGRPGLTRAGRAGAPGRSQSPARARLLSSNISHGSRQRTLSFSEDGSSTTGDEGTSGDLLHELPGDRQQVRRVVDVFVAIRRYLL